MALIKKLNNKEEIIYYIIQKFNSEMNNEIIYKFNQNGISYLDRIAHISIKDIKSKKNKNSILDMNLYNRKKEWCLCVYFYYYSKNEYKSILSQEVEFTLENAINNINNIFYKIKNYLL